jgi:hypothetical protein
LAPAAGPGWEEPTSQSYPKFLSGLDYVFTLPHFPSKEGLAYDDWKPFRATRFLSQHVGRAASSSDFASAISSRTSLRAQSLRGHMGRSFLPVIDKPQLWSITGPLYVGRQPSIVAPACIRHCVCCARRCSIILFHSSIELLLFHHLEEVPFVERTYLAVFAFFPCFHSYWPFSLSAQDSCARFLHFTHRLPTALSSPVSSVFHSEGGVRRYKPMLRTDIAAVLPRAPKRLRYQTAGSIGALARDEPVTPGVTFLSHPAPNSGDVNDR